MAERRAVFLDRDGTLIYDLGYLADPEAVRLLPKAVEGLTLLRECGLLLVLISNQSGVGRGYYTGADLALVHARMASVLTLHGLALDGVYYCLHAPWDGCSCRKPEPGLLRQAAEELGIDLAGSFMIGDKPSDVDAGRRAGCRTLLLSGDGAHVEHAGVPTDRVVPDLLAAARWIASHQAGGGRH